MQPEELEMCLRLVSAHWPTPEMGDDEVKVWTRALAGRDFDTSVKVIDSLSESLTRTWRPSDGEFVATYRQRLGRGPVEVVDRSDVPELPAYTGQRRTTPEWIAECRRILAECTGPLATSLGSSVGSGPVVRRPGLSAEASAAAQRLEDGNDIRWSSAHPAAPAEQAQ